jgi:hypothetical protein
MSMLIENRASQMYVVLNYTEPIHSTKKMHYNYDKPYGQVTVGLALIVHLDIVDAA